MVESSCCAWWFQICPFLILIAPPQFLALRNLKLLLQALLPWRSTPLLSYAILVFFLAWANKSEDRKKLVCSGLDLGYAFSSPTRLSYLAAFQGFLGQQPLSSIARWLMLSYLRSGVPSGF